MSWVVLGVLLLVAAVLAGRLVFRRYQDFRIRQHRRRMAWREYRQSRR